MPTISSARLLLRPAMRNDFATLYDEILSDEAVMQHVLSGGAMDRDEAEAFFQNRFAHDENTFGICTLIAKQTDQIVGMAGIMPCAALGEDDDHELAFVLARSAWGQGYATEIGGVQLSFALSRWGRALALAHPDNGASIRVCERLGMGFIKTIAAYYGAAPRNVYLARR